VARIEAIRLFLAYASFMGFTVYQMDVKGTFLYGTIDEEVHQVKPKECHLHAVKRIFRYLKGHPKLGLWYPKESPFDLVAYSDSDYGGATQDRKSTTRGCQFLGRRLISWQCKKQRIVATSTTEVEHVMRGFVKGNIIIYTSFVSHIDLGWVIGTFKYSGVLRILMISLRLIPLGEHNVDFHPMVDFIEAYPLRQYTRRTRIAQSSVPPTIADEPVSPQRDVSQEEACPTDYGFIADQDMETIDKSSTLPHDSAPRVTSSAAVEGSMQQTIPELMALCTSLQRQLTELTDKFQA
nr:putative ribonuclease H-like domain-containing protein [Tanacetum cinerariifolium]